MSWVSDDVFPLQYPPDALERRGDPVLWKTNACQPMNVRWLFAFVFDQQNCLAEPELALEQTGLVYDVFTRMTSPIRVFVFRSHQQKCEGGLSEHLLQALLSRYPGRRLAVEFYARDVQALP
jgi:hypothetical protein